MSLRETKKERSRRDILDAAERLLRRGGPEALSMRELAKEAGVSPSTPYNLLESKRCVLEALFGRALQPFLPRFALLRADPPLDQLYGFMELEAEWLGSDAEYHRSLLIALGDSGDRPSLEQAHNRRTTTWMRRHLTRAVDAGQLRPDTPVDIVTREVLLLHMGAYALWTSGKSTHEELHLDFITGLTLIVFGVATESTQIQLSERLNAARARWESLDHPPLPGNDGTRRSHSQSS